MLLHDDIMADGQAKTGAFSSRFGCEEGVEYLFLHLGRDACAVIPNPDFHTVSQTSGRGHEGRLIAVAGLGFTLPRRIKAVRDQV